MLHIIWGGGAKRLLSSESMILHAGSLYPFEVCTLLVNHGYTRDECAFSSTGRARLIRSHLSARFYFELSGNSNYIIHCNSNYAQKFELEINSI